MQPIDQKILSRIFGRGRGWAFTKIDFDAEFGEANIHQLRGQHPNQWLAAGTWIPLRSIQATAYEPMTHLVAEALEP